MKNPLKKTPKNSSHSKRSKEPVGSMETFSKSLHAKELPSLSHKFRSLVPYQLGHMVGEPKADPRQSVMKTNLIKSMNMPEPQKPTLQAFPSLTKGPRAPMPPFLLPLMAKILQGSRNCNIIHVIIKINIFIGNKSCKAHGH